MKPARSGKPLDLATLPAPPTSSAPTAADLGGALTDAALDAARWPEALARLAHWLRADGIALCRFIPGSGDPAAFVGVGCDPDAHRCFSELVARRGFPERDSDGGERSGTIVRGGAWVYALDRASAEPVAARRRTFVHGLVAHAHDPKSGARAELALLRAESEPHFDEVEVERVRGLLPELGRALAVEAAIVGSGSGAAAMREVLEWTPLGLIGVDAELHVLAANRAATRVLEAREGLWLDGRRLRARGSEEESALRRLVSSLTPPPDAKGPAEELVLRVERGPGRRPLELCVRPLRTDAARRTASSPVACILVADLEHRVPLQEEVLRRLHGLTRVEARLTALLASGQRIVEAAATLGLSRHTARTYLKSIFEKTGTSRQAELTRVVLSGLAPVLGA